MDAFFMGKMKYVFYNLMVRAVLICTFLLFSGEGYEKVLDTDFDSDDYY
jgi:hypothetical protein